MLRGVTIATCRSRSALRRIPPRRRAIRNSSRSRASARPRSTSPTAARAACRHPGDAPHLQLSHAPGLHRAVAARLPDAVHEYPLREQRGAGRFREAAARRQGRRRVPARAARHHQGGAVRPQRRRPADVALSGGRGERRRPIARAPNKLIECGDDLAGLPPADGIIFADAHPGNSINTLRGLNPAVANENNPPDAPLDRRARSVRSQERLQPERAVALFAGIPGALFQGAGRPHEPADRQRPRQARAHEAQRLPLSRRRHHGDPARRQSGRRAGRLGGAVRRRARHRGGQHHGAAGEAAAQRRHDRDAGDQERLRRRSRSSRATICASAPAPRSTRCARS